MATPSEEKIKIATGKLESVAQLKDITQIDEHIIREIVLRLPIKDLLRLKCVAKEYTRMISNPHFGYLYFLRNLRLDLLAGVLLYQYEYPYHSSSNFIFLNEHLVQTPRNPLLSLAFADATSDIHRISACNGLLCLCIIRHGIFSSYDYYICNPTTNKSIELPHFSRPSMSRLLSMTIAFDPQESPFYKVVCVWVGGDFYRFSIYCSETRHWKDTNASWRIGRDDAYEFKKGVFCFNSVHWISESGPFLWFDMENECCGTMAITPIPQRQRTRRIKYFGESKGKLHLLTACGEREVLMMHCMLEKNTEWYLTGQVDINSLLRVPDNLRVPYSIHCIHGSEQENGISVLLLSTPSKTLLIDRSIPRGAPFDLPRLLFKTKDLHEFKWYHSQKYIMNLTAV